jgi:hypothetical protein
MLHFNNNVFNTIRKTWHLLHFRSEAAEGSLAVSTLSYAVQLVYENASSWNGEVNMSIRAGSDSRYVCGMGSGQRHATVGIGNVFIWFFLSLPSFYLRLLLSFLIQGALTQRLKYKSLYEAQVPQRVDSPAHEMDHVEAALKLLREREISAPPNVTHVDLRQLLRAGIPVDLPDNKTLWLGDLDPGSAFVGKRLARCFPADWQEERELIAVFRGEHILMPHTNVRLQAGDRLLVIVSPSGKEELESHLMAAVSGLARAPTFRKMD